MFNQQNEKTNYMTYDSNASNPYINNNNFKPINNISFLINNVID